MSNMSHTLIRYTLGAWVLALTPSAFAASAQGASLMEIETGVSVDPIHKKVLAPAATFAPDTGVIYVSARLADAPPGTVVKAIFKYLGEGEMDIADAQVTTEGTRYVSFNVSSPDGGWPIGTYAVELFLDGREVGRQVYSIAKLEGVRRVEDSEFGFAFEVPAAWTHRVSDDGDHIFEKPIEPGSRPLTLRVQYIIKAANSSLAGQAALAESQLSKDATVENLFRESMSVAGQNVPYFVAAMRLPGQDPSTKPHGYTLVLLEGVEHYYWVSFDGPGSVYQESFPVFEKILSSIRIAGS